MSLVVGEVTPGKEALSLLVGRTSKEFGDEASLGIVGC
jgi:hypothetical protein